MLLAKAPPTPIPINLSLKTKSRLREPNWKSSHHCNERGVRLVVRARYTRTPMETPGAYQLIDNDTGEKFIVWGGSDDGHPDSPIPSKDILSWQPSITTTTTVIPNNMDDGRDSTTSISSNYANEGANCFFTHTHTHIYIYIQIFIFCSIVQFLTTSTLYFQLNWNHLLIELKISIEWTPIDLI